MQKIRVIIAKIKVKIRSCHSWHTIEIMWYVVISSVIANSQNRKKAIASSTHNIFDCCYTSHKRQLHSPQSFLPHQHAAEAQNFSPCAHCKPSRAFQCWIHWPFLRPHWEQLLEITRSYFKVLCEGAVDGEDQANISFVLTEKKSTFHISWLFIDKWPTQALNTASQEIQGF